MGKFKLPLTDAKWTVKHKRATFGYIEQDRRASGATQARADMSASIRVPA